MTRRLLDWYALSREAAPGVLLGVEATTCSAHQSGQAPTRLAADLMVGFEEGSSANGFKTPCVALIKDSHVGELFAWLHTYSNESFPISQFCRIETPERWESFLKSDGATANFPGLAWASVIAGEMLANAEQHVELKTVPLSWASNCFTYTMARAFRAWSNLQGDGSREVAARLRALESDPRFARRKLGVDSLIPIWALLSSDAKIDGGNIIDVIELVLPALDHENASLLRTNSKLMSSSAEQRIHGFDEFVDMLRSNQQRKLHTKAIKFGPLLAAAALIAGRSTSHIDLLRPYANEFPDCLPWFGLLAGFAGPRAWDSDWLRLVKGVERQIRNGFHLTDPMQSDLCWIEFDWLRHISKSASIFSDLPKYHSRLLTVEIFPGANYQLRLTGPTQEIPPTSKLEARAYGAAPALAFEAQRFDPALMTSELLSQLHASSAHLQAAVQLIEKNSATSIHKQGMLFEEPPRKTTKRANSRTKKPN